MRLALGGWTMGAAFAFTAMSSAAWGEGATTAHFAQQASLDATPLTVAFFASAQPADQPATAPDGSDDDMMRTDLSLEAAPVDTFGQKDTWRWTIQGGFGVDVKGDNYLGLAGVGASYFLIDDLSINFELNGFFVDQEGEDGSPIGINFNLLLRWHFFTRDNWTLYFDGGAGMLYTSADVPDNGSSFNFTPQAGFGMSFALNERSRLLVGARWHHISNANTYDENPGRDSIMGYVGFSFPF